MKQIDDEERDFLLWRYYHQDLTPQELALVDEQLASNIAWQQSLLAIQLEEQKFQSLEPEMPSLRFSKNIMESIEQKSIAKPANAYVNTKIIKFIGSSFVAIILAFLVYAISQVNWTGNATHTETFKLPTLKIPFTFGSSWLYGCFAIVLVCFFVLMDKFLFNKRKYRTI